MTWLDENQEEHHDRRGPQIVGPLESRVLRMVEGTLAWQRARWVDDTLDYLVVWGLVRFSYADDSYVLTSHGREVLK